MRWFDRLFHRRGVALKGFHSFSDLIGAETSAGIAVTPEKALTVPAVFSCIQVLSQDVAKAPIRLRQKVGADSYIDATDHDLYELLHDLPNPETSAFTFKQMLMHDLLTSERAFAQIVRVNGRVTALWRLDPHRMTVDRDEARRKRYRYTDARGQTMTWLFDASMPPIFELLHPSPLRYCRELIGTALALQSYTGLFFSQGARLSGVLQTDKTLSPTSVERLRESFRALYSGLQNAHSTAVLEDGMKFQPISAENDAAQLNETQANINQMIAGTFRVPTWKIGDLTKTSYANMEAGELAYVGSTLDPFFQLWEDAIRRDLLTVRQFGQFTVTFDRSALLRSDMKSLHDALAVGRQNGIYSTNDCRRTLGLNPVEGGDQYQMNGNMVSIDAPTDGGSTNGQ